MTRYLDVTEWPVFWRRAFLLTLPVSLPAYFATWIAVFVGFTLFACGWFVKAIAVEVGEMISDLWSARQ